MRRSRLPSGAAGVRSPPLSRAPVRRAAGEPFAAAPHRRSRPPVPSPAGQSEQPRGGGKQGLFNRKVLGASGFLAYIALADGFGPSINQRIRNHTHMAKKAKKATKKVAPKKAAAKPAAPKPIKEALSKSGLVAHIANATGVAAKDVRAVM